VDRGARLKSCPRYARLKPSMEPTMAEESMFESQAEAEARKNRTSAIPDERAFREDTPSKWE
jgi:hypothetical protein